MVTILIIPLYNLVQPLVQKLMDNNPSPFSQFLQKQDVDAKKENAHERDTIYHQFQNTLLLNEIKVKVVDQLK